MRPWRGDARLGYPEVISLTHLVPSDRHSTRQEIVAICIPCQHVFRISEWHARHARQEPHIDIDP